MKHLSGGLILLLLFGLLLETTRSESVNGPRRWKKVIKANSVVEYRIDFKAPKDPSKPLRKEAAEFALIGDGGTDVDVYVLDATGQPVLDDKGQKVQDIFDTDLARVAWFPKKTGTYVIRVVNLGTADNECLMGHN